MEYSASEEEEELQIDQDFEEKRPPQVQIHYQLLYVGFSITVVVTALVLGFFFSSEFQEQYGVTLRVEDKFWRSIVVFTASLILNLQVSIQNFIDISLDDKHHPIVVAIIDGTFSCLFMFGRKAFILDTLVADSFLAFYSATIGGYAASIFKKILKVQQGNASKRTDAKPVLLEGSARNGTSDNVKKISQVSSKGYYPMQKIRRS